MARWPIVFVLWVLVAGVAFAEPSPRDAARARFDKGQVLYNLGKLDEAIVEFEGAYTLDADPAYLFNLAQAHRLRGNRDRAVFYYRRYRDLWPDAPNRTEVEQHIAKLDAELVAASRAAADKAVADKLAAEAMTRERAALEKAATEKARAEVAAEYAAKRHRVGLEVGWGRIYLDGLDDPPPTLVQGASYGFRVKRRGKLTFEVGGSYHESTIPYFNPSKGPVSASYSQVIAAGTITFPIAWRVSARIAAGMGVSTLRNLQQGNPVTPDNVGSDPQGMFCSRADATAILRLHPLFDVTLTLASSSLAPVRKDLDPRLKKIVTLEGFHLGLHVRL